VGFKAIELIEEQRNKIDQKLDALLLVGVSPEANIYLGASK